MKTRIKRHLSTAIYRFDASLNRHIGGAMLILLFFLGLLITISGALMSIPGWGPNGADIPTPEGWWMSLTRSLDPGTFGADNGFKFRILGLLVTLAGVLALAIVIGLISNAVDRRITYLRSGRTEVMESGHFLILGWSNKAITVVQELLNSSSSSKARIVILARQNKDEIEELLEAAITHKRVKQVVVRTGDYTQLPELTRVKPVNARSVVVINEEFSEGDADVVRTVMSLLRLDPELSNIPVVTEIRDQNIARALTDLCGPGLIVVNSLRLVARITAQTLRNPGLSSVYEDLLNFDGDELYLVETGSLTNFTFGDAQNSIFGATLLGIENTADEVLIAPDKQQLLADNDLLLVLAKNRESIEINLNEKSAQTSDISVQIPEAQVPEHFEIFGWSDLGPLILSELDAYLPAGSTLSIRFDPKLTSSLIPTTFENFSIVQVEEVDTTDYEVLSRVICNQRVDHVMILCYREAIDTKTADARTLLTLAQIRHILDDKNNRHTTLISELLDVSDVDIAQVATPDDYVVSERLASLLIAQLATQPRLHKIFSELFSIGGHDIVFRQLQDESGSEYLEISIDQAKSIAHSMNQIFLGWKTRVNDGFSEHGVIHLNPSSAENNEMFKVESLILLRKH